LRALRASPPPLGLTGRRYSKKKGERFSWSRRCAPRRDGVRIRPGAAG
jgi:hypothetical protein